MVKEIKEIPYLKKVRGAFTNFRPFLRIGALIPVLIITFILVQQQQDVRQRASETAIEFGFNTHVSAANNNLSLSSFTKNVDDLVKNGQKWIRFNIIDSEIATVAENATPSPTPTYILPSSYPTPTPYQMDCNSCIKQNQPYLCMGDAAPQSGLPSAFCSSTPYPGSPVSCKKCSIETTPTPPYNCSTPIACPMYPISQGCTVVGQTPCSCGTLVCQTPSPTPILYPPLTHPLMCSQTQFNCANPPLGCTYLKDSTNPCSCGQLYCTAQPGNGGPNYVLGAATMISWNMTNLAVYDQAIDYAKKRGLKVFLVTNTPVSAKNYPLADYKTVTSQYYEFLSSRYKGKVNVWQIFNEADTRNFRDYSILSSLDPKYLYELNSVLTEARSSIKANDPLALVTANVTGWPMSDQIVNKWYQFFDATKDNLDILTADLYPDTNKDEILKLPTRIQGIKDRYSKDVYVGEIGICTAKGTKYSETDQSTSLKQDIDMLKLSPAKAVLIYEIQDESTPKAGDTEGMLCEGSFGIKNYDGSPKSSFSSLMSTMQPLLTPTPTPACAPIPSGCHLINNDYAECPTGGEAPPARINKPQGGWCNSPTPTPPYTPAPSIYPCYDGVYYWQIGDLCGDAGSFKSGQYKCTDGKSGTVTAPSCTSADYLRSLATKACATSPKTCPFPSVTSYPTPQISCMPRPSCLDSNPACMIAEPANGWCPPNPMTPTPTPAYCKTGVNSFSLEQLCGTDLYRFVRYSCYDGFATLDGGSTSCKSSAIWKQYAEQMCKGRSSCDSKLTPTPYPTKTACGTPPICPAYSLPYGSNCTIVNKTECSCGTLVCTSFTPTPMPTKIFEPPVNTGIIITNNNIYRINYKKGQDWNSECTVIASSSCQYGVNYSQTYDTGTRCKFNNQVFVVFSQTSCIFPPYVKPYLTPTPIILTPTPPPSFIDNIIRDIFPVAKPSITITPTPTFAIPTPSWVIYSDPKPSIIPSSPVFNQNPYISIQPTPYIKPQTSTAPSFRTYPVKPTLPQPAQNRSNFFQNIFRFLGFFR